MSNPATPNLHKAGKPNLHGVGTANSPPAKGEYPEGGRGFLPKLRFSEFRDEGEWANVPIDALLSVRNERLAPTDKLPLYSLTIEDGITPKSARYSRDFLVADPGKKKYKLVEPQDIVFNPSNLRWGAISHSRLSHAVVVSPIYEVLYVKDRSATCFDFVARALMRPEQIARFIEKGQGTLVERIAVKIEFFVETILPIPMNWQEQQKIADCLNSLDDLIAAENQKLEALRQHKQGLMQQLFRQLGETVPRLRFPEFIEAPRWQISTFGERCESFSGSTPDTSNKTYYGGTIPFIRSAEIGSDKTEIFLTKEGLKNSAAKMVRRGDLLVALYGANSGDTALARVDGAINQAIMCLRSNDSVQFLYHYLIARKNWIITTYLQGGQGNLSGQIVLSVKLSIPDKDEQQKIAACLNSLDDVIAAKNGKLETLRYHKQGLMQQLFPSLESY